MMDIKKSKWPRYCADRNFKLIYMFNGFSILGVNKITLIPNSREKFNDTLHDDFEDNEYVSSSEIYDISIFNILEHN